MGDKNIKFNKNVAGPFYCDTSCIACNACVDIAMDHFTMDEQTNLAYVYKQPQSETERAQCIEAQENCPVDAIGSDG